MDEKRKVYVLKTLLKRFISKQEIKLDPTEIKRRIGNLSKETGIPVEEIDEIGKEIFEEMVKESFSK